MFNEYPYVNLQDVNLDWILKHIKELEINLQDFVKLNTIKYADPIIWNITSQYETNTVVIDGNTGTAYISVQPVPKGVALTNDDYWTVIFTLNLTTSNQNITLRDDGTNVVATFASNTGDWILWNFYLYRVTQPISVNTAYVEGFNIERFTVELFIKDYINTLAGMIGDLDDLNTTDKDSLVDAINEVLGNLGDLNNLNTTDKDSLVDAINEVLGNLGDLNNLNTTDKDSLVDATNEVLGNLGDLNDLNTTDKDSLVDATNEVLNNLNYRYYVTPEMFGAVGDGLTDDTAAIQNAIDSNKPVMFSEKTYLVTASGTGSHDTILLKNNTVIKGNGATLKLAANGYDRYRILTAREISNVWIDDLIIIGDKDDHSGYIGELGYGISVDGATNIHINNCKCSKCWGDGLNVCGTYAPLADSVMSYNVYVNNFETYDNRRQGISVEGCDGFYLNGAYIHDISGTVPQSGIDFEPSYYGSNEKYEYIDNVFVNGLKIENTTGTGILFADLATSQEGKYILEGCTLEGIRFNLTDSGALYGSCIIFNDLIIDQKANAPALEMNITNANSEITISDITIKANNTFASIFFDSANAGKVIINNVAVYGSTSGQQLIEQAAWIDGSLNNVILNGVFIPNNALYPTAYSQNIALDSAVVKLSHDIKETTKHGWFYLTSIANIYYFSDSAGENSYMELPHMFDGYELTIINSSSTYRVALEKENANRPNIYFDNLNTSKTISVGNGSITIKYDRQLKAWITKSYSGDVMSV